MKSPKFLKIFLFFSIFLIGNGLTEDISTGESKSNKTARMEASIREEWDRILKKLGDISDFACSRCIQLAEGLGKFTSQKQLEEDARQLCRKFDTFPVFELVEPICEQFLVGLMKSYYKTISSFIPNASYCRKMRVCSCETIIPTPHPKTYQIESNHTDNNQALDPLYTVQALYEGLRKIYKLANDE